MAGSELLPPEYKWWCSSSVKNPIVSEASEPDMGQPYPGYPTPEAPNQLHPSVPFLSMLVRVGQILPTAKSLLNVDFFGLPKNNCK